MDKIETKLRKLLSSAYLDQSSLNKAACNIGLHGVVVSMEELFELIKNIVCDKLENTTDKFFSSACRSILFTLAQTTNQPASSALAVKKRYHEKNTDIDRTRPIRKRKYQ